MFGTRTSEVIERGATGPGSACAPGSPGEPCSPTDSPESPPSSPDTASPLDPGALLASDGEHPEGAGAFEGSSAPESEPKDPLADIHLDVAEASWASSPQDINEFIQMYLIPGDDDLSSLDQYLLPSSSPQEL